MRHIILKESIIILLILFITSCSSENNYYGFLDIDSVNIHLGFYNLDNPLNDVSKNIELIDTGIKDTYLLAGHSGTGKVSFFNNLRYLKVGDEVNLRINNKNYKYIVNDIIKEKKSGKLKIEKKSGLLILTTCDQEKKGYQLIIKCIIMNTE